MRVPSTGDLSLRPCMFELLQISVRETVSDWPSHAHWLPPYVQDTLKAPGKSKASLGPNSLARDPTFCPGGSSLTLLHEFPASVSVYTRVLGLTHQHSRLQISTWTRLVGRAIWKFSPRSESYITPVSGRYAGSKCLSIMFINSWPCITINMTSLSPQRFLWHVFTFCHPVHLTEFSLSAPSSRIHVHHHHDHEVLDDPSSSLW
jgi:hypothetical protein